LNHLNWLQNLAISIRRGHSHVKDLSLLLIHGHGDELLSLRLLLRRRVSTLVATTIVTKLTMQLGIQVTAIRLSSIFGKAV
jgi:hypothetical protein